MTAAVTNERLRAMKSAVHPSPTISSNISIADSTLSDMLHAMTPAGADDADIGNYFIFIHKIINNR